MTGRSGCCGGEAADDGVVRERRLERRSTGLMAVLVYAERLATGKLATCSRTILRQIDVIQLVDC